MPDHWISASPLGQTGGRSSHSAAAVARLVLAFVLLTTSIISSVTAFSYHPPTYSAHAPFRQHVSSQMFGSSRKADSFGTLLHSQSDSRIRNSPGGRGRTNRMPLLQASSQQDDESEDASPQQPKSSNSGNSKSNRRGRKPWWAKLKSQKEKKKRREERQASSSNTNDDPQESDADQDSQSNKTNNSKESLLETLDPYRAGQKLRRTLDTALTTLAGRGSSATKGYYLDDRFMESSSSALYGAERNPLFDRMDADDFAPEVLVVGATGAVGRLVVRRLLLDGRFRVRVLVRDLYSRTLNILGTGVTYCQGDLGNVESLEYALTDVDKIVFCAGAPRPDEEDFRSRFEAYVQENLLSSNGEGISEEEDDVDGIGAASTRRHLAEMEAEEWNRLESVLEVRSKLAEQVDAIGMANIIHAYQNVRHADYGTGQAAKRSLFKFDKRPEDFNLFAIDVDDEDDGAKDTVQDKMAEEGADAPPAPKRRKRGGPRAQCDWIKNDFGNAVFVGSVPTGPSASSSLAGEAAVVSSRLSSREDPESGLDLGLGFAGFVCRLCSDGGIYECFVRTAEYERSGVEYVCEFGTGTKQPNEKQSRNKFTSVRLPFSQFKAMKSGEIDTQAPPFAGTDVRQIGFRFRGSRNNDILPPMFKNISPQRNRRKFYLALSYIKVYRSPPEPEFIYLSDARIPPTVKNGMVRDDVKQIIPALALEGNGSMQEGGGSVPDAYRIFDEEEAKRVTENNRLDRSNEETYFKYKGEKLLRDSGLK